MITTNYFRHYFMLIFIICFFTFNLYSATYTMGTSGSQSATVTSTSGAPDSFYDNGGAGGNHSSNIVSATYTFTPSSGGNYVRVKINTLNFGNSGDILKVYNGATTAARKIDEVTFANNGQTFMWVSTSSEGSLTFEFISDAATVGTGWDLSVYVSSFRGQEWLGGTSAATNVAANWEGSLLPTLRTSVYIPNVANDPDMAASLTVFDFRLESVAAFTRTAGSLTVYGDFYLYGAFNVTAAYTLLNGGSSLNPAEIGGSGSFASVALSFGSVQNSYYKLANSISTAWDVVMSVNYSSEFDMNNFDLTVTGTSAGRLTIPASQTFYQRSGTLSIASSAASIVDASFNEGTGTTNFNRAGSQTIPAITYYNLTVSGGGANIKTLAGTTTVTGALSVAASTSLDVNSRTINVTGAGTIAGTSTISTGTVNVDGTYDATGGSVTFSGAGNLLLGGATVTSLGTFTCSTSTVAYDRAGAQTVLSAPTYYNITFSTSNTKTLGGALTVTGNLTIDASVTLDASGSNYGISLAGNWTNNGTFTPQSGTVTFNGSVAQVITTGGITAGFRFYNLTINNSAATPGDATDVDADAIYVSNLTTVTDGQFQPATGSYFNAITITTNGILKPDASAVIYVSGNWTNSGTFTCNTGTVEFNGTSTINSGGIVAANEFYKVILNGTSATLSSNSIDINNNFTITLGTFSVGTHNMYIGANWINNGTFSAGTGKVIFNGSTSRTVTGSSVTSFYDLEIDKGTDVTSILDITVASNVTHDVVFTAGLLRLTHSSAIISADDISYNTDISSGAGLHLNGGSYTNGDNYVFNNSGYFRVTSGTATVGTASDNTVYNESATSVFILDGGTLNCAGRFRSALGSTTISSGTLTANTSGGENIATRGVFEISTGSDFSMSGGTVILQTPNPNASGNDLYIVSGGTKTITGGTFQIGNASTAAAQSFKINSDLSLYNLTINTTNSPTAILQQNTTVSNNFINGGVFDAKSGSNYALTVGGEITNNGTFTARSGTVTLNGGSAQEISGAVDPNFYNLTLNNASGASISVNTTVQSIFTFSAGLFTTQGYTLAIGTNGTNGSVSGYSSTRYFVAYDSGTIGSVKQFINLKAPTSYVYPIGDLTNYTPFTITVNSASTLAAGAYFTMYTKAAKISGLNASITTYLTRYWRGTDFGITTPDYDVSYAYSATDVIGGTEANLMPIKKSGSIWYKPTGSTFTNGVTVGTGSFTVGTRTLSWAGLTSFSDYGGVGPQAVSLPIELISFSGKKMGDYNELNWITHSESNNDYFTIEKTKDGLLYEIVGTQNGVNNSSSIQNYSLIDQNIQKVINYYRLIQTDYDGKNKVSNLITIDNREVESTTKVISRTTNILGQEIDDNYRGLIIITYSDGSSMKTIRY